MKRILKILAILLALILVFFFAFFFIKNEPFPNGESGLDADYMADKMMASLNVTAWNNTAHVSWESRKGYRYDWNRKDETVVVRWSNYEVKLSPKEISGQVFQNDLEILGEDKKKKLKHAWDNFNNDSFWLCAPYKAFDPGTERSIVTLKDGRNGLMVTYTTGGTTPGDSYVWILGADNRPTSIKMWVSILPIGGMEFTWENYQTLPSGAMLAQDHFVFGSLNVSLKNIR